MPFSIDDGYTLEATMPPELPAVKYRYRPALPTALADWRYAANMAKSGSEEIKATANLIVAHLVDWDIVTTGGVAAQITVDNILKLPEPILDRILKSIVTWSPRVAEGNSAAG